MKRKPPGWPKYMEAKPLAGGIRYFWNAPTWARKRGCPIKSDDYAAAKARCDDYLNPLFKSWLTGGDSDARRQAPVGVFDWLVAVYKSKNKYTKRPPRTRRDYDRALEDVAGFTLTDGRRFGVLNVNSIKAATVDKLYEKLKVGSDGKPRHRSALLSMTVCKLAWDVAHRAHPTIVPATNPFKGIEIEYEPKKNRAANLAELMRFVRAADDDGTPSLGTAAMIAFYWLVREEDIFSRMAWSDYRPAEHPNDVLAWHHKNRKTEKVALPLFDADGTPLFPEIVARLEGVKQTGTLMVMRDDPDPRKKIYLPWTTGGRNPMRWVQAEVRRICRAARLPDAISFTSFRHGGHTDGRLWIDRRADACARRTQDHGRTAPLRERHRRTASRRRA